MTNEQFKRVAKVMEDRKEAVSDNETWDKFERCREILGDAELLEALIKAMDWKEANENLDFIIQMYEIPMTDEEEDW